MFDKKIITNIILSSFLLSGCGGATQVSEKTNVDKPVKKVVDKKPKDEQKEQPNTKPVAKIVKNITIESGKSINVFTEVYDKENDKLSFMWKEGDKIISTDKNFNISNLSEGTHNLTFIVTDSKGATDTKIVSVKIIEANDKNDAPTAIDQNIITDEDNNIAFELNAYDVEGDNLTINITKKPSHGKLTGRYPYFTYTPDKNFYGIDKISYKANDGKLDSKEATIYIKINSINNAPTVNAGKDKIIRIGDDTWLSATAEDKDGDIVKYQWKEGVTILSNKPSFKYKPTTTGNHKLSLTVTDNDDASATDTVIVSVSNQLPMVVVRVEFKDYKFQSPASTWSNKIFGTKEGQLNHYYNEISYGKLQFEKAKESYGTKNDGIITVSLDIYHPGTAAPFQELLPQAIKKTDSYIDYSQYDKNSDGNISIDELQIMFLFAGGEAATGQYPGIWAHAHCIYEDTILDDTEVMSCGKGTYSIFGERHKIGDTTHDATIGIIAHELGHAALGLIDLYDIDFSSEGIGNFGLMGSGNWARKSWEEYPGETPVHMIGWNKIQSKFIEPVTVKTDTNNLEFIKTSDKNYKLYKIPTQKENEYFLVENRAKSGYDQGLFTLEDGENFTGGLSIIHIDENKNVYNLYNTDEHHKLADIEEAKNAGLDINESNGGHRGHVNNLYFSGNSDSFTPTTTPNSNLYDGTKSGISITNISDSGDFMHADIKIEGE